MPCRPTGSIDPKTESALLLARLLPKFRVVIYPKHITSPLQAVSLLCSFLRQDNISILQSFQSFVKSRSFSSEILSCPGPPSFDTVWCSILHRVSLTLSTLGMMTIHVDSNKWIRASRFPQEILSQLRDAIAQLLRDSQADSYAP